MKEIAWSRILSVSVKEVDEDHRKLFDIFNLLNRSIMESEPDEYIAALLDELINCTVWHFSHEERLMLKYRYEEAEAHKEEHRALIESARELQNKVLRDTKPVAEEHLVFLERWLTEHILTTDARMGFFLSQVM